MNRPGLERLGDRWGTPLYVLDEDRLRANLRALCTQLAPADVLFSLKTNYLPAVTRVVKEEGVGLEVASGYELRAALNAGFPADRIVFNGPVKTAQELRTAVEAGILVNIDGEAEVDVLAALAAEQGRALPVGLRVFPPEDVYAGPPPLPRRATPSKFGWPILGGDADRLVQRISDYPLLRLSGLHCHLGSQITRVPALLAALESVFDWAAKLMADGIPLEVLNLGGGFAVPGIQRIQGAVVGLSQVRAAARPTAPDPEFHPTALASGVRRCLDERGLGHLRVCWEPGRAVVSDTMVLLTRVQAVKRTSQGAWVLLDGGLNLLPTAGIAERHHYQALRRDAPDQEFLLGGPLSYEGDAFSLDALLPADVREGDYIAVHDAGAYSITRANSFNRQRAAVAVLRGDQAELCWRAETDEDTFRYAIPAESRERLHSEERK
ncbi:diaminopimelate decarboxylase family protein [Streptomyces sp. NPDC054865]